MKAWFIMPNDNLEMSINILITGAQLDNKGAESMLYITVDEMKKRFPNSTVYFASNYDYDDSNYAFKKLIMSMRGLKIAMGGPIAVWFFIKGICFDAVKFCLGRRNNLGHFFDVKNQMKKFDLMIDVSGFNLGNQWPEIIHQIFLDRIELARRYNIPVYLMPQSFGPFDYALEMEHLKKRMIELLQYPELIFAREKEGYDDLINTFGLSNVKSSADLVLQNRGIDWRNVFKNKPLINIPIVNGKNVVGIVPNQQCFNHGNKNWIIKVYSVVISHLLKNGNKVVIFRHSKEDINMCNEIFAMFKDDKCVEIENKEFSCLEYDEYVKQFNFIICSRFHGIVHAYRNNVPAIALGWAIKYQGLADCVGQGKYAFDITEGKCSIDEIVNAVKDMEEKCLENSQIIRKHVKEIQKDNCFNQIKI